MTCDEIYERRLKCISTTVCFNREFATLTWVLMLPAWGDNETMIHEKKRGADTFTNFITQKTDGAEELAKA